VSTTPKNVGVVEVGLVFCTYGCGALFSASTMHMDPPYYLKRVSPCPVGEGLVSVNVVVFSNLSSLSVEYGVVDGVVGAEYSVVLCLSSIAYACVRGGLIVCFCYHFCRHR